MRSLRKAWGQCTVRQAGAEKNKFDKSKSFGIEETKYKLSVEQISTLFRHLIDKTQDKSYNYIMKKISAI